MIFEEFLDKYQKVSVVQYPNKVTKTPLVSVFVQTYQHANYIRQCLDGILMQQTDFEFEILLGEDASTDGTKEICIEYAEKYPDKIKLFLHHRENNIAIGGSPSGRFNFIYNFFSSKGKYIALCEGDDYWTDPLKLQKQVDFLELNTEYSLVGHRVHKVIENKMTEKILGNSLKDTYKFDEIATKNVRVPTASILFRNSMNFPKWFYEIYGGDRALIFLAAKTGKVKILNFVGGCYRVHSGGVEQNFKKDKFALPKRNIEELNIYIKVLEGSQRKALIKRLSWNHFYLSIQYLLNGSIFGSALNLFQSIKKYIQTI